MFHLPTLLLILQDLMSSLMLVCLSIVITIVNMFVLVKLMTIFGKTIHVSKSKLFFITKVMTKVKNFNSKCKISMKQLKNLRLKLFVKELIITVKKCSALIRLAFSITMTSSTFLKGTKSYLRKSTMYHTTLTTSTVVNTDHKHCVRIFMPYSVFQPIKWKYIRKPILRVGAFVIMTNSQTNSVLPVAKQQNLQNAMYLRTLIAILIFPTFYEIRHKKLLLVSLAIMDWLIRHSRLKTLSDSLIQALCAMILSQKKTEFPLSLLMQSPNMLLIDTSLSLKDIVGLLLMRFQLLLKILCVNSEDSQLRLAGLKMT